MKVLQTQIRNTQVFAGFPFHYPNNNIILIIMNIIIIMITVIVLLMDNKDKFLFSTGYIFKRSKSSWEKLRKK